MEIWTKLLSDLFSDTVGIASFSVIALTLIIVSVLISMFIVKSR
ncbi:DUF3149 domain-containing protein [Moritella sp. 24]|nr:DUF3149 domain-containing protein [Moritella sp. 24]QUM74856.1 DUF3149 domain-containing protein [Moritella sp. 24]